MQTKKVLIFSMEKQETYQKARDKTATGDHDESGDVFKFLGKICLKIRTQQMNNVYETGEWPKDFTEIKMIALNA